MPMGFTWPSCLRFHLIPISDSAYVPLQVLLFSLSPEPLITFQHWLLAAHTGPWPTSRAHNLTPHALLCSPSSRRLCSMISLRLCFLSRPRWEHSFGMPSVCIRMGSLAGVLKCQLIRLTLAWPGTDNKNLNLKIRKMVFFFHWVD